ncbi:MAG: NAD(P)/FAD-dependent oxidoreductase [Deltaproteobacteria bacterium]|jgi:phytoene dehydrogenase-like protein
MPKAVVIGSGPNGLAAATYLADRGVDVEVLEAADTIGGGTRTAELTLPGFRHDVCSAAHPMGILSPYLSTLPLADHGLTWRAGAASFAHPLDDDDAVLHEKDLDATARALGADADAYRRLVEPFVRRPDAFLEGALAPLRIPSAPFLMASFGLRGMFSVEHLAKRFSGARARALLAGCAAHGVLPFDRWMTAAFGLIFCITGHVETWPVAEGGSSAITTALAKYLETKGGRVETNRRVTSMADLPDADAYLFDTDPAQLANIAGDTLPSGYRARLERYRYGPAVCKVDWALDGSIPWRDERCRDASTVHVGGTFEEIAAAEAAVWRGEHPERPFLIVCQQSELDPSRAPDGKHTGYAYCHVPADSDVDHTAAIEAQVERFAPGFCDRILARHTMTAKDYAAYNPNHVGGAISGGVADIAQLFFRPVARLDPYRTPNDKIWICSASTPPGGGVHGMCGYWAARSVARRLC